MEGRYVKAMQSGILQQRIEESRYLLGDCTLCPRQCKVDRLAGKRGYCRIGRLAEVASYGPHFGEESVLVGSGGSGTIFFCGCNLGCRFCQNYEISRGMDNCQPVEDGDLAAIMMKLQAMGCQNINFVSPTHVLPQILAALPEAIESGLRVPLVYNCGGYESVKSLRLLDTIVDIYLPDAKFWNSESSARYADAVDYREKMVASLGEMQRQVGDLQIDDTGLAEQGLIVRHLLMPGGLGEAESLFRFLVEKISKNCYLNIMDQYRPCGEARAIVGLGEPVSDELYGQALKAAKKAGLTRLDRRDLGEIIHRMLSFE
jgi:putative pyruvate formate lyase activating enzyme